MHSFLLTRRLRFLSYNISKVRISSQEYTSSRDEQFQLRSSLYSDMLQYYEDYPEASFKEIYSHYVDDEIRNSLAKRYKYCVLIGITVVCAAILVVGYLTIDRILQSILENTPIYFSNIQHFL